MKRFFWKKLSCVVIALAVVISSMLTSCVAVDYVYESSPEEKEEDVWDQVFEAYTFTYPLVLMDLSETVCTNTEEAGDGKAPINQLAHERNVADASFRAFVTPNCDTVYTKAWMDVSEEPVIYVVPETDRFYESQIMDGWTNTFIAIEEPGVYAFARKDWEGELPDGVTRVDSPTSMVWMLARVLLNGKDDLDNVVAIQEQMQMMPLSDYLKGNYEAPKGTYSAENDFVPAEKVAAMTPQEFFDAANRLMVENPPADADKEVMERLNALNVGPGLKFDASILTGNVEEKWSEMIETAEPIWLADSMKFVQMNGIWMYFGAPLGNFGTEYVYRALTAHDGIGANTVDVAIYPKAETDSEGNVLTGEKTYIMHFDSLPPVTGNGFWSVTAYGEDFFLIDNPIDRYAINDRTDFKLNEDGSLDVILSNKEPKDTSNWLPVCPGVFQLFMRMYKPDIDAFNNWTAPTITPVDETALDVSAEETSDGKYLLQEAFDYTLPVVMVELTKRNGTNVEADNGTGYAPLNQLGQCKFLLDASFKGVVTPNVDTLYSNSYMDIGDEPMIITMPEADRYMAAQIMDGWTNNVALINEPGTYAFVKKGYEGELPDGVEKIEIGTDNVWLIIRTLCNGKDDLENIYKLQDKTKLVPLSAYTQKDKEYIPSKGEVSEEDNYVPVERALGLSIQEYFDLANSLMENNSPAELDKAILEELSAINVGPGCTFDPSLVDEKAWKEIHDEVSARYDQVMKSNSVDMGQWGYLNDPIGNWGDAYDYRAAIALKAIGANSLKTAVYATTYIDEKGNDLKGNGNYVMHFDSLPSVGEKGFWSVTAYSNDDFLIDNPIDRYCINDRTDFKLNNDGTLDIIISAKKPSDTSNWLPISGEDFHLYLRMYEPILDKLDDWTAPVITNMYEEADVQNNDMLPLVGEATDYAKAENWMHMEADGDKEVDLIYFYPTVTEKPTDGATCKITPDMKDAAHYAYAETGSAFSTFTNVYAPYYTQLPITINKDTLATLDLKDLAGVAPQINAADLKDKSAADLYRLLIALTNVRTDAYAALDYYFDNYNNGKPFILAGHSQGSAVIEIILSEYMRIHPEHLKKMVAAYAIGFPISQEWMDANPHLKFAEGAEDTGVIISYNTEGPDGGGDTGLIDGALAINPINWKRDDTPASVEDNKGKLVQNHTLHSWKIEPATTGAVINLERGTVVVENNTDYDTPNLGGFGDKTLHTYDYGEFYINLRENAIARSNAFLGHGVTGDGSN